eukprot:9474122-Pyramimonas_sp.AAC.1
MGRGCIRPFGTRARSAQPTNPGLTASAVPVLPANPRRQRRETFPTTERGKDAGRHRNDRSHREGSRGPRSDPRPNAISATYRRQCIDPRRWRHPRWTTATH